MGRRGALAAYSVTHLALNRGVTVDWPLIVLEYVKTLSWPTVVGGALWKFREPIAEKLRNVKSVSTPVGSAEFSERAEEVFDESRRIEQNMRERAIPLPATPAEEDSKPEVTIGQASFQDLRGLRVKVDESRYIRAMSGLVSLRDFGVANKLATDQPEAAISLGYDALVRACRDMETVLHAGHPQEGVDRAVLNRVVTFLSEHGFKPDAVRLADDLSVMRNQAVHGGYRAGGLVANEYVDSCERFARALSDQLFSLPVSLLGTIND